MAQLPGGTRAGDSTAGSSAANDIESARPKQRPISRRSLLLGAAGSGLVALLAACGSDAAGGNEPTSASSTTGTANTGTPADATTGEWEFTDDRGITISLPARPERIVVYSTAGAALWDYGVRPIGIFGPQRNPDGSQNPQAGEIDLDALTSIGEDTEALDLEQLVALNPDLIIGLTYDGETIWPLDTAVVAQMEEVAPFVGMSASGKPADELIARFEELAVALGADLMSGQVAEDRERFEQAVSDLEAAIAEKPELSVLFVAGSTDMLYVGNPNAAPDLMFFREHGLDIAGPDTTDYFENLSWEQAGKYQVDLVFNDARGSWYSKEQLAAEPTWQEHPAQQAGQIGDWLTVFALSHRGFAKVIEELTATVRESRDDVA